MSNSSRIGDARAKFRMVSTHVNLAHLSMTPHPEPVQVAIEMFRRELDTDPFPFLRKTLHDAEEQVSIAAGQYFGLPAGQIALTDSTTTGLTLLYAGLPLAPGQEILTTSHEFSGALEVFGFLQKRMRIPFRTIPLLAKPSAISLPGILSGLEAEIAPHTRVLALTWVYSNSGVKLPLGKIAALLKRINAKRAPENRVLLCVDGVHGFGVEDTTFPELGVDFFVAGCHKWICGPRGTGIWFGTPDAWSQYQPIAPTSSRDRGPGSVRSPGGVHDYEHRWALKHAFDFLLCTGKADIQQHIHGLAKLTKEGLKAIPGVTVVTPMDAKLSSGIVSFDIADLSPADAVAQLETAGVVATQSSSDAAAPGLRHVRFSLSIFNTKDEVRRTLAAVAKISPAAKTLPAKAVSGVASGLASSGSPKRPPRRNRGARR